MAIELTPFQIQVATTKIIEGTYSPSEWRLILDGLEQFDRIGDKSRKKIGISTLIALVAAIVGGIVFGIWAFFPLSILTVILFVIYLKKKKFDLPPVLENFLIPVVSIISEEMDPREMLNIRADMRGACENSKCTGSEKSNNGYPKIETDYYKDLWFSGKARLADDSRLEWEVTDDVWKRKVTKKTISGKYKMKTKFKVKTTVEMKLGVEHDSYAAPSSPQADQMTRIDYKSGEKRDSIRIRRMFIKDDIADRLGLNEFLDVLAEGFNHLKVNPSKEEQQ